MCYIDPQSIPNSGWREDYAFDTIMQVGDERDRAPCVLGCGKEHEQFIHVLVHDHHVDGIGVCYQCALTLTDGSDAVLENEARLRRWQDAKTAWATNLWPLSKKGNEYQQIGEHAAGVYEDYREPGKWRYWIKLEQSEEFIRSEDRFHDVRRAKRELWNHLVGIEVISDVEMIETLFGQW